MKEKEIAILIGPAVVIGLKSAELLVRKVIKKKRQEHIVYDDKLKGGENGE